MAIRVFSRQIFNITPASCQRHLVKHLCDESSVPEMFTGPVPREKLNVRYSRSSGPGGQNVNKLNTKAEVRFHLDSADWLPDRVKRRIKLLFKTRLNKEGELMVVSQKHRSQLMNLEDAITRLDHICREASQVPKGPSQLTVSRVKALKRAAERKRLTDKKYHSSKKRERTSDI